jgi:SMODS-associating 2TM, beta-strand rich effector domain
MNNFYPYATDSAERETMSFVFAALSLAIVYLSYLGIERLKIQVPWYLALPSPMGVYWLLQAWFTNVGWRWRWLHNFRIVRIPDLNGNYEGALQSSYDHFTKDYPCRFEIKQTWKSISVTGHFEKSSSFNMVSGISVSGAVPRLTYEYGNKPRSDAPMGMVAHDGTIGFGVLIEGDDITLDGDYYTGRSRETYGCVKVQRTNA